jgi:hypothetical protein
MPDYSQGKIYSIYCLNTGKRYIGSTCCSLEERLRQHKAQYNCWKKKGVGCTSFIIIEQNNYRIELIEEYSCTSLTELQARERHYIQTSECVNIALTDRGSDYYKKNRDKILAYNKTYAENLKRVYTKEELQKQKEIEIEKLNQKYIKSIQKFEENTKKKMEKFEEKTKKKLEKLRSLLTPKKMSNE